MNQLSTPIKSGSIYILHGWTYSIEKWTPFVGELGSKGFDVKLLKIPGLTDKIDKPWTIDDYVSWLDKKLKNDPVTAGQEKVILVGHSNGGRIALNFSIKYPGRIAGLVLIDSAGIYHNDIFIRTKRSVFFILAKIGKKIIPLDGARKLFYFLTGEKDYGAANPIMKKTMVNLIQSDKILNLNKVNAPTIIIWGEHDNITPLSDGKLLNQKIVNSKLYIIDNARHSPQFTHAKEVVNIIVEQL